MFSCEFCKISKNTFFTEHLRWLLLSRSDMNVTSDELVASQREDKIFITAKHFQDEISFYERKLEIIKAVKILIVEKKKNFLKSKFLL